MCLATLRIAWDMQGFVVEIRTQWRVPGTKILNGHVTSFGDLAPLFPFLSKHPPSGRLCPSISAAGLPAIATS